MVITLKQRLIALLFLSTAFVGGANITAGCASQPTVQEFREWVANGRQIYGQFLTIYGDVERLKEENKQRVEESKQIILELAKFSQQLDSEMLAVEMSNKVNKKNVKTTLSKASAKYVNTQPAVLKEADEDVLTLFKNLSSEQKDKFKQTRSTYRESLKVTIPLLAQRVQEDQQALSKLKAAGDNVAKALEGLNRAAKLNNNINEDLQTANKTALDAMEADRAKIALNLARLVEASESIETKEENKLPQKPTISNITAKLTDEGTVRLTQKVLEQLGLNVPCVLEDQLELESVKKSSQAKAEVDFDQKNVKSLEHIKTNLLQFMMDSKKKKNRNDKIKAMKESKKDFLLQQLADYLDIQ